MKKNRDSSELAARIAAAANQPAGRGSLPAPTLISQQSEDLQPPLAREPEPSKPKNAKRKEPDTVPISLRPTIALLNKFVLKASERTREEGRVVSAQQIMLETLERSVL